MKRTLLTLLLSALAVFGFAQTPTPLIWGASPFQDSLWAFDTLTWAPSINVQPQVTGSVITGCTGMAFDPTTYKSYVILKSASNGTSRYLAEISLPSGSCTVVGSLGDRFSSITFDRTGQLYGVTGNGATVPETFFRIDKATASNTVVFAMGNGADGEIICYNRYDNQMYHWSGNGSPTLESWPIASTSYTPTNIPTSGASGGETFGAINLGATDFIISNIASQFKHMSSGGSYGATLLTAPDDIRGLIMPPRFAVNTTTVCARTGSVNIYSNCLNLYDSVYYYWGDATITQVAANATSTAAISHTYATAGTYTLQVKLYNGAVAKSTIQSYVIQVNSSPLVTLSGNTNLCPGATLTLTGSSGGASQWYAGGVAVPGATLNTLAITSAGRYNMMKINLNGCADSANVGVVVVNAPSPTVSVANATICAWTEYTISPSGAASYTISGGSAIVNPSVTTSYSITGTSTAGCVSQNTAIATINVLPLPTLTLSSSNSTICVGESATLTVSGANSYSWTIGGITGSIVITPSVSTPYNVSGTNTAGCVDTARVVQEVALCTGLNSYSKGNSKLRVIPNPSHGAFVIESGVESATIEVYNGLGQLVFQTNLNDYKVSIDLSNFTAGIYNIRVMKDNALVDQIKILKE